MDYWSRKEELKKKAVSHTGLMECKYHTSITQCVKETRTYSEMPERGEDLHEPKIVLINTDSVDALFKEGAGKTAVLNFASYKNPGGMFINGSSAQEESLCHESFLFNVLKECSEYYEWNNKHKNKALYLNRALYSPKVVFIHNDKTLLCDVITCAAPNYSAAKKYQNVSEEENERYLKSRILFVRNIAEIEGVKTLILGAYGCGVFGQNPETVANFFKEAFATTSVQKIVYAVPGNDKNYLTFKRIFGG